MVAGMHTLGQGQVPKRPGTMLIQDLWFLLAPSPAPSLCSPGPWLLFPQASLSKHFGYAFSWPLGLLSSLVHSSSLGPVVSVLSSLFSSSLAPPWPQSLFSWPGQSGLFQMPLAEFSLVATIKFFPPTIPRTCRVLICIQTSAHGTCMVGQKHTTRNSRYFVALLIADCWQHQ